MQDVDVCTHMDNVGRNIQYIYFSTLYSFSTRATERLSLSLPFAQPTSVRTTKRQASTVRTVVHHQARPPPIQSRNDLLIVVTGKGGYGNPRQLTGLMSLRNYKTAGKLICHMRRGYERGIALGNR